jgi:hypothetical protein
MGYDVTIASCSIDQVDFINWGNNRTSEQLGGMKTPKSSNVPGGTAEYCPSAKMHLFPAIKKSTP